MRLKGNNVDKDFEYFIDKFGKPTVNRKAKKDRIEKYRGKLPDKLLEYWNDVGFCGFKNGLFWIVDPSDYESMLEGWIGDTEIIKEDNYYVIARSGFGELFVWGTKTGNHYTISPYKGWIFQKEGDEEDIKNGEADEVMQTFFAFCKINNLDLTDENDKPLFEKAVKKFGALKENEVFGFEPAPLLGGSINFNNINKVDFQIYSSILLDFGGRQLLDMDDLAAMAFG